jgi:hypothetical protein
MIGSRARISEVLNGQRPLTIMMIKMIKKLRDGLDIPADVLLGAVVRPKARKKTAAGLEARPLAKGKLSLE